jgi:hypothetical protein
MPKKVEPFQKALETVLRKAGGGPYIGPKGGKWADPQHTIPWKGKEGGKKVPDLHPDAARGIVLPSEEERGKAQYDADFKAGYAAGKAAAMRNRNLNAAVAASRAFGRVKAKHGSWYKDGFTAAVDMARGAYATKYGNIARKMGLHKSTWSDIMPKKVEPFQKALEASTVLRKAGGGPYIGPKGGKYADPEHKTPWKAGEVQKVDKHGGTRERKKLKGGGTAWHYSYPGTAAAKRAHKHHKEQAAKTTGKKAAAHRKHAEGAAAYAAGWGKLSFVRD